LPADPTLKIQIVRFLVETNLAPELLDTMSSPQTILDAYTDEIL